MSKLACLMFTYELQRRLEKAGSGVISVGAHPGISMTNLGQNFPKFLQFLSPVLAPLLFHPPDNAALPTLYAALGSDIQGGDYTGPTGRGEWKGKPGKVRSTRASRDEEVAARLWAVSEELTGIEYLGNIES